LKRKRLRWSINIAWLIEDRKLREELEQRRHEKNLRIQKKDDRIKNDNAAQAKNTVMLFGGL